MKQKLVLVGNGMAGMRTIDELLKIDPTAYEITVIGEESHGNYNRIMLSPVLAGEQRFRDIVTHDTHWYRRNNICLKTGHGVVDINREQCRVILSSGEAVAYDLLLLATGSRPTLLPIPGVDLKGVMSFRSFEDVKRMQMESRQKRRAAVIGAGVLGLEAAEGLRKLGMDVTVVHHQRHIMNRQLDGKAAQLLKHELSQRGIDFRMDAHTKAIIGNAKGEVTMLRFDQQADLEVDLVIMTVGVQPNAELARQAGLLCDRGVLIDQALHTNDPKIYAVGECVQLGEQTFGLVSPLFEQAEVLAQQLMGNEEAAFTPAATTTSLKVSAVQLFSAGDFLEDQHCESIIYDDNSHGIYKKLVVKKNRLIGALCYGDITDSQWYLELIRTKRDISELRESLIFGQAYSSAA